jgi:glutamate racemase
MQHGVSPRHARTAVTQTRHGRIGVIGTAGTVASGAYPAAIHALLPDAKVFAVACPLFVPLAEEGWLDGEVPLAVAQRYLAPLLDHDIDTLVLGCTHYPLLTPVIQAIVGPGVTLVDSAEETARVLETLLETEGLRAPLGTGGTHTFLASDAPESMARVGARFLGQSLGKVEWVDF